MRASAAQVGGCSAPIRMPDHARCHATCRVCEGDACASPSHRALFRGRIQPPPAHDAPAGGAGGAHVCCERCVRKRKIARTGLSRAVVWHSVLALVSLGVQRASHCAHVLCVSWSEMCKATMRMCIAMPHSNRMLAAVRTCPHAMRNLAMPDDGAAGAGAAACACGTTNPDPTATLTQRCLRLSKFGRSGAQDTQLQTHRYPHDI